MGILRGSDAEVRPVANLIRQRKTHHYGLGGFPHERLHQDTGILPVSCLFPGGQDAHSTHIHSNIQQHRAFKLSGFPRLLDVKRV